MNDVLAPVSKSNCHSVLSNNFPDVYQCSEMGKDSSTLSLSPLDLSDLPKYVVLRSEFSSNPVVFTISCYVRQCWLICVMLLELSRGIVLHI